MSHLLNGLTVTDPQPLNLGGYIDALCLSLPDIDIEIIITAEGVAVANTATKQEIGFLYYYDSNNANACLCPSCLTDGGE